MTQVIDWEAQIEEIRSKATAAAPPFGKNGQRRGPIPRGAIEPTESPFRHRQEPSRNQQPPWLAGALPERPSNASEGPQQRKGRRHPSGACERPIWPRDRRRRVRRVFLELIFLRDTLRARLATLGGRRRPLPPSSTIARTSIKSQRTQMAQEPPAAER